MKLFLFTTDTAYEAMGRISYKHKQFFSKQKIEEFLKQ